MPSQSCRTVHQGHRCNVDYEGIAKTLGQTTDHIQVDNGSEFISKAMDRWAYD